MTLRASQIETLRAFRQHGDGEATAATIGAYTCRTLRGERRLLDELEAHGMVESTGRKTRKGASYFRLTNQGRTALEEAGNG